MKPHFEPAGPFTEEATGNLGTLVSSLRAGRVTVTDPAVSQAQQRFMAIAEHHPEKLRGRMPNMTRRQLHDFAATPRKGLPERARGG